MNTNMLHSKSTKPPIMYFNKNIMRLLLLPCSLLISASLFSQRSVPSAYSSTMKVNYVRTWDAVKPDTSAASITTSVNPTEFKMTTQYLDGLGRPLQTVIKKGSMVTGSSAVDMV